MYYVPQDIPRLCSAFQISDRTFASFSNKDIVSYLDEARRHYTVDLLSALYKKYAVKTHDDNRFCTTVSLDVCILSWEELLNISRESYARGQKDGASETMWFREADIAKK